MLTDSILYILIIVGLLRLLIGVIIGVQISRPTGSRL